MATLSGSHDLVVIRGTASHRLAKGSIQTSLLVNLTYKKQLNEICFFQDMALQLRKELVSAGSLVGFPGTRAFPASSSKVLSSQPPAPHSAVPLQSHDVQSESS